MLKHVRDSVQTKDVFKHALNFVKTKALLRHARDSVKNNDVYKLHICATRVQLALQNSRTYSNGIISFMCALYTKHS